MLKKKTKDASYILLADAFKLSIVEEGEKALME